MSSWDPPDEQPPPAGWVGVDVEVFCVNGQALPKSCLVGVVSLGGSGMALHLRDHDNGDELVIPWSRVDYVMRPA